jgi:hypothetical protein
MPSATFLDRMLDHANADLRHDALEGPRVELRPVSRDRLQLVQSAAGVTEAAPRDHRHRDAARRDRRREANADLVADAAGRVLVDLRATHAAEPEDLAGLEHRLQEGGGLGFAHAAQEHRHEPGAHLIVGHASPDEAVDQRPYLGGLEDAAVSLPCDERDRVEDAGARHLRLTRRRRARIFGEERARWML